MFKYIKCLLTLVIVGMSLYVNAQEEDCSSCHCSPPDYHAPIGVMIDHGHQQGQFMVSYRLLTTFKQGSRMGAEKISADRVYQSYLMNPDNMRMQMHMAMLMYGLSDKITLMGMVDYMHHSMGMSMLMQNHVHTPNMNMSDTEMGEITRTSGLGDTKLSLLYTLLENEKYQLILNAGISLPTGSISKRSDQQRLSYSMQNGTGSVSLMPGITFMGQNAIFSWGTQVLADIKTMKNKEGYQMGNEFVFNGWLAHSWNNWLSNSLRINGSVLGKIKGFDPQIAGYRNVDPDADARNSGGYSAGIFAGLNLVIPQGVLIGNRLGVELGFPFYQNLNGIQSSTKLFVNAGWQFMF